MIVKALKRLAYAVWMPLWIMFILLSLVLWPVFWIITGKDLIQWWIDSPLEPYHLKYHWLDR